MRRTAVFLTIAAITPMFLAACDDSSNSVIPQTNAAVSMVDACDSASFNAGIAPGTCTKAGGTTLASFNAELSATHSVSAWHFDPSALTIRSGDRIVATNNGGEEHTFTEVAAFGGGVVPALNTASGNTTETPECAETTLADHVKPGQTFTTDAETAVGTHFYQCCIHPWMRTTVTVTG